MSKYVSEEVLRISLSSLKYASVTQSTSAKIHLQVANCQFKSRSRELSRVRYTRKVPVQNTPVCCQHTECTRTRYNTRM